ncbi:MAG: serine/threonine-protein kinase [Archangium sp.]|nr:serine/threonine-protein kinase [Archangium sp.]
MAAQSNRHVDPLIGVPVSGYRIERLIGEGGMALVYQARHEVIDRRFAIKVLRPEVAADELLAKNFLREAQTLSALRHPNIVDIVGFGPLPDGRQAMVMEFLEGQSLEQEMAKGRLTFDRALLVADQALKALEAAHSVEVIHRDLKPANVFLAHGSGGVEVVKLLDFGLSRQQPARMGARGATPQQARSMVAGTPEYVAPEQALGGAPDKSSDLYSFGVMLFEMLTGRLPFEPGPLALDRVSELLLAHANQKAPSPEAVGAALPHEVSVLLRELLEKQGSARPADASVVRVRLAQARAAEGRRFVKAPSRPLVAAVPAPQQRPYLPLVGLIAHATPPAAPRSLGRKVVITVLLTLLAIAVLGAMAWVSVITRAPDLPAPLQFAPAASPKTGPP